jgi:hypothetical protein
MLAATPAPDSRSSTRKDSEIVELFDDEGVLEPPGEGHQVVVAMEPQISRDTPRNTTHGHG